MSMKRDSKGRFVSKTGTKAKNNITTITFDGVKYEVTKDAKKKLDPQIKSYMTKQEAKNKATALIKSTMKDLKKKLNDLFTDAGVWYSITDYIKEFPNMHKTTDRNADQFMIDHAIELWQETDGHINRFSVDQLWTKSDIGIA